MSEQEPPGFYSQIENRSCERHARLPLDSLSACDLCSLQGSKWCEGCTELLVGWLVDWNQLRRLYLCWVKTQKHLSYLLFSFPKKKKILVLPLWIPFLMCIVLFCDIFLRFWDVCSIIAWIRKKSGLVHHWFWKCARRSYLNFGTERWSLQSCHVGFQLSSFVQGQFTYSYMNWCLSSSTGNSFRPLCLHA